jgi:magnesium-protoporphyrin O-methyltransferase
LSWLPDDLSGLRLLDAGCGTGALALEAAARGAQVVAIDLSETLVTLARERASDHPASSNIEFMSGDMLATSLGTFDHVVAMDSVIHYRASDALQVLSGLAQRTRGSIVFTFAPSTPLLTVMHAVGRAFPKGDRAPAIVPVSPRALLRGVQTASSMNDWRCARTQRISSGFYTSQAMELVHQ